MALGAEGRFRHRVRARFVERFLAPPFASKALGRLSRLSVWWIQLGVLPDRIEPGQPQQNGRHERFHRTLKEQTASPPRATLAAQQRAFDIFRADHNERRPHEAVDLSWKGKHVLVGELLEGQPLGLRETADDEWELFYGTVLLGYVLMRKDIPIVERII
jgi:hypothetical protein